MLGDWFDRVFGQAVLGTLVLAFALLAARSIVLRDWVATIVAVAACGAIGLSWLQLRAFSLGGAHYEPSEQTRAAVQLWLKSCVPLLAGSAAIAGIILVIVGMALLVNAPFPPYFATVFGALWERPQMLLALIGPLLQSAAALYILMVVCGTVMLTSAIQVWSSCSPANLRQLLAAFFFLPSLWLVLQTAAAIPRDSFLYLVVIVVALLCYAVYRLTGRVMCWWLFPTEQSARRRL